MMSLKLWNYILENLKGFELLFWLFYVSMLFCLLLWLCCTFTSLFFKLGRPSWLNKLNETYVKALSLQTDFLSQIRQLWENLKTTTQSGHSHDRRNMFDYFCVHIITQHVDVERMLLSDVCCLNYKLISTANHSMMMVHDYISLMLPWRKRDLSSQGKSGGRYAAYMFMCSFIFKIWGEMGC